MATTPTTTATAMMAIVSRRRASIVSRAWSAKARSSFSFRCCRSVLFMTQSLYRPASVVAQCEDRVDPAGAMRRNQPGRRGYHRQQQHGRNRDRRIVRLDAVQHLIDEREYGRVGTDAERERQDRDGS